MSYGMKCNKKEIKILESNNIDFTYWDMFSKDNFEIEIDSKSEFLKACELLHK